MPVIPKKLSRRRRCFELLSCFQKDLYRRAESFDGRFLDMFLADAFRD